MATSPIEPATSTAMKTRKGTPERGGAEGVDRVQDPGAHEEGARGSRGSPVASTSETFQTFSIPRRSCTMIECRNAVPVSHGISEAFSTGSHAQ